MPEGFVPFAAGTDSSYAKKQASQRTHGITMQDVKESVSSRPIYDVLIVGAGPVGLATALGLWQRGITNILVIDQTREFRKVGQVVDLLPNGLKALRYVDAEAYERLKEFALNRLPSPEKQTPTGLSERATEKPAPAKRRWCQRNMQGDIIHSFETDFQSWCDRYGEGRISTSWFNLQTTLRELLPPERIQANHRCIHVEETAVGVRVDTISDGNATDNPFAHWHMLRSQPETATSTPNNPGTIRQSFAAKLVVAADGINSMVRQILYDHKGLQKWAKPQYSGFAAIRSRLEHVPDPILRALETQYFQGERIVTVSNPAAPLEAASKAQTRMILLRTSETGLGYSIFAALNLDALHHSSPAEILNLGLEALKEADFLPVFLELVGLSKPEQIFHRPYFLHPVQIPHESQPIWSQGRVVLVGDAAHGMPPFMAQGANQGFEDAALIVPLISQLIQNKSLDNERAIATEFERYEQIRQPFMETVQTATMTSSQWSQQQRDDFNEILHRREFPVAGALK